MGSNKSIEIVDIDTTDDKNLRLKKQSLNTMVKLSCLVRKQKCINFSMIADVMKITQDKTQTYKIIREIHHKKHQPAVGTYGGAVGINQTFAQLWAAAYTLIQI